MTLNPQTSTFHQAPSTLNPGPQALRPTPSALPPKLSALALESYTLNPGLGSSMGSTLLRPQPLGVEEMLLLEEVLGQQISMKPQQGTSSF